MLTITLAAVLGLLGVVAVLAYARQANERAVNGMKAETVVEATGAIPIGTSLNAARRDGLLGTERVPVSSVSKPAVHSVTSANGRLVTTGNVGTGQLIFDSMLAPAGAVGKQSSFSLLAPKGYLAVEVNMCIDGAVGGYATPGSYVAIFDTIAASPVSVICDAQHPALTLGQLKNAATLLVLPKVEVLALGPNPSAPSTSEGSSSSVTVNNDPSSSSSTGEVQVTVAVNQSEAQRLILMEEVGLPYMALIGPDTTLTPSPQDPLNHQLLQQP
jgi:pilus assembly protein CpaB